VNAEAALSFRGVRKTFGRAATRTLAIDDISFSVASGKITGLIGPDGAGKTTLMRLAAGLLKPDCGDVRVLGEDPLETSLQARSALGYMPQRFGLYEDLTVQENLDLYADLHGVDRRQRSRHYTELMHMTGLAPFTRRLAGRLSGGMKQKLGLACTLVRAPSLLLLDEPTVGVDPISRRELWSIIDRLVKSEGLGVLLSTAYLSEAERCNEVLLLHEGRLVRRGAPQTLRAPMRGRTFLVRSTTLGKRDLQHRLSRDPYVLDAVIENERVRIVARDPGPPALDDALVAAGDLRVVPTAPIFEDAFVALLKPEAPVRPPAFATPRSDAGDRDDQVIAVERIQRRFGDFFAVRDVSFTVRRGEIFGLLGANGAGKSTTFRMLCGMLPVSAGKLTVAGNDLRRASARARSRLGYMAQRFSLYVDLTVMENLKFFARIYGLGGARRRARIAWALETFELGDYADRNSGDLPAGFRQRLALAAALMHEPEILFLDEPTSGVDPLARREFWSHINALAGAGVTVLVTTHFMDEADYCDRLVIMADGEIMAAGTPAEMKSRFRSASLPEPSMEDAFIGLMEQREHAAGAGV